MKKIAALAFIQTVIMDVAMAINDTTPLTIAVAVLLHGALWNETTEGLQRREQLRTCHKTRPVYFCQVDARDWRIPECALLIPEMHLQRGATLLAR